MDNTAIADNLRLVRDRIANAAISAGRKPEDVTLVAVSKTKPAEAVVAAMAAGQTVFGENRVQEAEGKFPALRAGHRFDLHLIGGLQKNAEAGDLIAQHNNLMNDAPFAPINR